MIYLLAQVASTWAMTGIIWFVQLVQYPSFGRVPRASFPAFHAHHSRSISWLVAPLMVVEALSALSFIWAPLPGQAPWQIWLGVGLVAVIWVSTFLVQVPAHTKLGAGFDEPTWSFLVQSNWLRTIAWSLRAALVSYWLCRALGLR